MMNLREKVFYHKLYLWCLNHPQQVKDFAPKATLHRLSEADVDTVAAAHRNKELIIERLRAGYKAYWLERDKKCIHIHWYGVSEYFVWDIRCTLSIPEDKYYVFDVYTDPEFRRHGIFGYALRGSMEKEGIPLSGTIYMLTRYNNQTANTAFERLGFEQIARISLTQIPPVRRFCIYKNGDKQAYLKIMKFLRNRPVRLELSTIRFVK